MIAWIGLGANCGPMRQTLARACGALDEGPLRLCGLSALHASHPMGPADQPDFLNAAACVASALGLRHLLQHVKALEVGLGRVARERWRERELDLDLLLAWEDGPLLAHDLDPALDVPHPGLWSRPFVLAPLMDLLDGMPPSLGRQVEAAWERLSVEEARMVWRVEEAGWFRSS